jgi:hypothetical protein
MQKIMPNKPLLLQIYQQLPVAEQNTLLAFAEFLASRVVETPEELPLPADIPRPQQESVIAAVKRLSQTYAMLDKSILLHQTSALVTAHLVQGRERAAVIDELETLFADAYQNFIQKKSQL